VRQSSPDLSSSIDSRSWDDILATSSTSRELSKQEYDELVMAMMEKFENDAREEEELLLAEQLNALDEADKHELDLALEQMQAWEIDDRNSDPNDPIVLCPFCKTRRLLAAQSNKSRIFCGCENGFRMDIDGGLVFLRDRLASAFDNHRAFKEEQNTNSKCIDLMFQFGHHHHHHHHRHHRCNEMTTTTTTITNSNGISNVAEVTSSKELDDVLFASCNECGFLEAII